jgi:uncharacterized membrane protein YphA (DoxX/SURF4 family)
MTAAISQELRKRAGEHPLKTGLLLLARLGLAAMFLYAGAMKLGDPAGFAADLSHYRVLPDAAAPVFAVGLPVLEIVTAGALLLPAYVQGGAALSALMLFAFAAGMAQAKLRGIDLECGCFGTDSGAKVSWAKVALNAGLAILSLWIMRAAPTVSKARPNSPRTASA